MHPGYADVQECCWKVLNRANYMPLQAEPWLFTFFNNQKNKVMKTIEYRIKGTGIIGSGKTVRECRNIIADFYGKCSFEWWSSDGKKSGNANVK